MQKRLDHAKQSPADALKTTSKIIIQKLAEETGDLIGNKNANENGKASITLSQNNSEVIRNKTENMEPDRRIPNERYISPEKL